MALLAGATTAGVAAGWLVARNLRTLRYRRPHERDRPGPTWHRWLPAIAGAGAALVATTGSWERLTLAAPLLTVGVWLASVDADVRRLPFRGVLALGLLEVLAVAAVTVGTQKLDGALMGLAGAAVAYLGFRLLHRMAGGDLGYGDVTLAPSLALATTTAGGPVLGWLWIMISLVAAALYSLIQRGMAQQHRPLGPWLVLGAVASLVLSV